ncbi:MAG TPA: sorbosone dehydrogenase family protein [Chitinophagaceae bacterium]|jgi:glucose/arabinose dehydrogenase|nr:sorbosone dehydrogenase family protein [Chitinophagaceae bacterium]
MKKLISALLFLPAIVGCNNNANKEKEINTTTSDTVQTGAQTVNLPEPYATESVRNMSKVIGWPADKMPQAPAGFVVTRFADSLDSPRWIYVTDDGDIFVAESSREAEKSANRITLFKDKDNDGIPESRSVFLTGLNQPFGMLKHHDHFYVANTDALMQYDYKDGAASISTPGKKILSLPGGPRHWTRNIIANAAGTKIYIAVGSGSNVAEDGFTKEIRRANIIEVNPDGTGERIYASGLRNPVGMDWAPGTNTLWTAVNERDELGDDLVPDYMTSVKEDGFYGWPWSYFGNHIDPRLKDSANVNKAASAIVPDYALNAHTASLGLVFYKGGNFPDKYNGGAFIGQHGSWNRSAFVGYKVVFVPFSNGKPSGPMEDFLTGFIADESKKEVYGRPVGVAVLKDGSLLVADDGGNKIWRVSKK